MPKAKHLVITFLLLLTSAAVLFASLETKLFDTKTEQASSIIYESADILHYADGSPYIHPILTNHTEKTITELSYYMLSYDEAGSPLALHWNFLDSSEVAHYDYLVQTRQLSLAPNQTQNTPGGWSLAHDDAAYALFCLQQVVFDDGTCWQNPHCDSDLANYAGKAIALADLQNYYPQSYTIPSD